jgi:hypothetical protein
LTLHRFLDEEDSEILSSNSISPAEMAQNDNAVREKRDFENWRLEGLQMMHQGKPAIEIGDLLLTAIASYLEYDVVTKTIQKQKFEELASQFKGVWIPQRGRQPDFTQETVCSVLAYKGAGEMIGKYFISLGENVIKMPTSLDALVAGAGMSKTRAEVATLKLLIGMRILKVEKR